LGAPEAESRRSNGPAEKEVYHNLLDLQRAYFRI
jgi:hypothetical protein